MNRSSDQPTVRQLRCLRALASRTGTTFTTPTTKAQASREIDRIKRLQPLTGAERRIEQADRSADRDRLLAASTVTAEEITGYGSTAKWANARPVKEPETTPPITSSDAANRSAVVGERVELSRYSVSSGERVIYGQRINGIVRITDRPADGQGRSYLIERELEQDGNSALKALLADYTAQAADLDEISMATSVLRRTLELLAA